MDKESIITFLASIHDGFRALELKIIVVKLQLAIQA